MTVNVVALPLTGMVIVPDTVPPEPPAAPLWPPPPPAPFIVKVNEVTPAGTVRVYEPAVVFATETVKVSPVPPHALTGLLLLSPV
jgi:hypothetical protein